MKKLILLSLLISNYLTAGSPVIWGPSGASCLQSRLYFPNGSYVDGTAVPSASDTIYGAGWNGDTTGIASKNSIYDKVESVVSSIPTISDAAYGSGWNGDTSGASKNSIYDKIESLGSGGPTFTAPSADATIVFDSDVGGAIKGTGTTVDKSNYWREGNMLVYTFRYRHSILGTTGVGHSYIFTIPNSLSADTALVEANNASDADSDLNAFKTAGKGALMSNFSISNVTGAAGIGTAHLYSATQFRIVLTLPAATTTRVFGPQYFGLGNTALQFSGWVKIPISGW